MEKDNQSDIVKFYENQDIFITGGSGFVGKVLIEKLLRECSGLRNIYVLIRGKKGKNSQARLEAILQTPLFNLLREKSPKMVNKIHAIEGDCMQLGLGISDSDLNKLKNVSIVFHSAASVRFDDPLHDAVIMNVRGTYELLKIAEKFKNLKSFVHVSTTYCYPHIKTIDEKIYPVLTDWRTSIKLAETYDTDTLDTLFSKYSYNQPNTYTFTKGMAEHIVNEYKDKIPVFIFRPSIVVSTIEDPIPGWIDNFNGPIGLLVACGLGILRTNYADPDLVSDFITVDIVVRGLILSVYKRGIEPFVANNDKDIEVYNCASALICPVKMCEIIEIGKECIKKNPFEKTLWVPGGSITRCRVWNLIRFITLHIMMALIVDGLLRLGNQKPFLMKLQRRIYAANVALYYFLTNAWVFKNENFMSLHHLVPENEIKNWGFLQYTGLDVKQFLINGARGAKQYLLMEPAESTRNAHIRLKIYQTLHFLAQFIGGFLILRWLIHYITSFIHF